MKIRLCCHRLFDCERLTQCFHSFIFRNINCSRFLSDENLSRLAKSTYWEKHHRDHRRAQPVTPFDWILPFEQLCSHLEPILPTRPFIFMDLGCGTSDFTFKLSQVSPLLVVGYQLDFSVEALQFSKHLMKPFASQETTMNYNKNNVVPVCCVQSSAERLPFLSNSVDVILDKGAKGYLRKNIAYKRSVFLDMNLHGLNLKKLVSVATCSVGMPGS